MSLLIPYSPKPTTLLALIVVASLSVFIHSQHSRIQDLEEDLAHRDSLILEQELTATKQANELSAVSKTLADISQEKAKVTVEVVEREIVKYRTSLPKVVTCAKLSPQAVSSINTIITEASK